MARIKLSKEEKEAQKARQQQIRQLWQSAGIKRSRKLDTRDIYSNSSKWSKTLNMFFQKKLQYLNKSRNGHLSRIFKELSKWNEYTICLGQYKKIYGFEKIYTAPSAEIGLENLSDFAEKWDDKYAYISRSLSDNWEQLSTFWTFTNEIRRLIYTTNPIESFNRCLRKVTKNRPPFLDKDSLIKSLFLGIQRLQRKWTSKIHNWGVIYSQLQILFNEKLNVPRLR